MRDEIEIIHVKGFQTKQKNYRCYSHLYFFNCDLLKLLFFTQPVHVENHVFLNCNLDEFQYSSDKLYNKCISCDQVNNWWNHYILFSRTDTRCLWSVIYNANSVS